MHSPWSQTASGDRFDILDPKPEQVQLNDIATQLAKICRFSGACRGFYSVAQHSVEVANLLPPEMQAHGLLHDAHEMIVGDLTSPVKRSIHAVYHRREPLKVLVSRIDAAIFAAFGLPYPMSPQIGSAVQLADLTMLATERRDLMAPSNHEWEPLPPPRHEPLWPLSWQDSRDLFLERAKELWPEGVAA